MQILFIFTLLLFIGVGVYKYFDQPRQYASEDDGGWKTFSKVSLKDIKSYPTTGEEKKEMKISDDVGHEEKAPSARDIASINHSDSSQSDSRPWKGVGPRPLNSEIDNEFNPLWKDKLGKNLLRFLRPKTKTIVKRESSAIIKHKGKNLLVEHVMVKLKSPEGRHYGYNAYVDSASGQVLHTWNRTIHEQLGRKSLRFSPHTKN